MKRDNEYRRILEILPSLFVYDESSMDSVSDSTSNSRVSPIQDEERNFVVSLSPFLPGYLFSEVRVTVTIYIRYLQHKFWPTNWRNSQSLPSLVCIPLPVWNRLRTTFLYRIWVKTSETLRWLPELRSLTVQVWKENLWQERKTKKGRLKGKLPEKPNSPEVHWICVLGSVCLLKTLKGCQKSFL